MRTITAGLALSTPAYAVAAAALLLAGPTWFAAGLAAVGLALHTAVRPAQQRGGE